MVIKGSRGGNKLQAFGKTSSKKYTLHQSRNRRDPAESPRSYYLETWEGGYTVGKGREINMSEPKGTAGKGDNITMNSEVHTSINT